MTLFGMRHRSNLDILRAVAVSCVLIHHVLLTLHTHVGLGDESLRRYPVALGHAGVLAFFVHTSLVLMYSLERMHASGDQIMIPFYIRRFFRIYPLSIAAILIALTFHIPYKVWDTPGPISHAAVVANLLLVQNLWTKQQVLGPLWSLPFEVQMYVVLPGLYRVAVQRKAVLYLMSLFAGFCAFGALLASRTAHLNMAAYVPCFISGVLCYALRHRVAQRVPAWLWPPFLLLTIATFLFGNKGQEEPTFWSGWIFCLVLGLSINAFRDSEFRLGNLVAERVAVYSYGMYLLHIPVLYFVFVYLGVNHMVAGAAMFFALTGIAAVAAFHLVESPFMDLGRQLSAGRRVSVRIDHNEEVTAP